LNEEKWCVPLTSKRKYKIGLKSIFANFSNIFFVRVIGLFSGQQQIFRRQLIIFGFKNDVQLQID
jgi:hypothetical protein